MKWNEKQKKQLRGLAFEERSNAEIAEIMGIALTDVYSARSRFGWTIPKVREAKYGVVDKDKKKFIDKLTELLKMTRQGIEKLELKDNDTVFIHYKSGGSNKVNIAGNSEISILKDVVKNL